MTLMKRTARAPQSPTVFDSRPLPDDLGRRLAVRLVGAHREEPFSSVEPRRTIRRVAVLLADLGVETGVYRGALDLRGTEVDHLWLGVRGSDEEHLFVVDAAFPLFATEFVTTLRRFVAGDAEAEDLAAAAASAGVEERVLGEYPTTMRYRGNPVWSQRDS